VSAERAKAPAIAGVLLAGGLSRRMGGGDKGFHQVGGRTILEWIIDRARSQVSGLALNANGDPARFAEFGLPIVADSVDGNQGPLAGVLTAMEWAGEWADNSGPTFVATFPTDAPFLPVDLVQRLYDGLVADGADMACAMSGGRRHPVVGLWPVSLAGDLRHALVEEDIRKVDRWTARHKVAVVPFDDRPFDPFFNANTPEDLAEAEKLIASTPALAMPNG